MSRDVKYIGMDVHKEATVIAVLNGNGDLVMESIVETKASSLLQFIHGLRGELHVTWEEGTWAAWLYDLLKPHVQQVLVCDPRRNALLKEGNKNDKVRSCLQRHPRHRGDRKLRAASLSSLVPSPEALSWPSACAAWGTSKAPRRFCFSHWARRQQRLQFSSSLPTPWHEV